MESKHPAIEIQSLSKTFPGGKKALKKISLQVQEGEMVALIGASGSGKSTLIRHVGGLIQGDKEQSGSVIRVQGQTVQESGKIRSNISSIRKDIGVTFQQFNLVPRMRVLTNVLVGLLGSIPWWRGTFSMFTSEQKMEAMRALDRVGIADTAKQRAENLSGGQQQRAAIARTLVQKAKVILADEPIASLDPGSAKRVMEILDRINREDGITIMVSLHQVEYARRYCQRTIAMCDGEIAFDGPSKELDLDLLRKIYGEASEELILPDAADGEILTPEHLHPIDTCIFPEHVPQLKKAA